MHFPKQLPITVTIQDIDNGIRVDCSKCPVALVLRRMFPNPKYYIRVTSGYVEILNRNTLVQLVRYKSDTLKYFIDSFDSGQVVKPCSFTLLES